MHLDRLTITDAAKQLAKAKGKPCVYLHFDWPNGRRAAGRFMDDVFKACPILGRNWRSASHTVSQGVIDDHLLVFFPNMAAAWDGFDSVVGDSPNSKNPYKGQVKVYALLINGRGQAISENT